MSKLYICSTPIGNLKDITLRTIEVLKKVDLIVAEDTRITKRLLDAYNIGTRITSYYKYDKVPKTQVLLDLLKRGKSLALVCDAGTPLISDPGSDLISCAIKNGIEVIPLPGANAILPALIKSGFACNKFLYLGYLPKSTKKRRRMLKEIKGLNYTTVIFISPHNIVKALEDMCTYIGERRIALVRELTKIHEEVYWGTAEEIKDQLLSSPDKIRGEFTMVISHETNH